MSRKKRLILMAALRFLEHELITGRAEALVSLISRQGEGSVTLLDIEMLYQQIKSGEVPEGEINFVEASDV